MRRGTGPTAALVLGVLAGCGLLDGGTEVSKDAVDAVVASADVVASGSYGNPAGEVEFRGQALVVRPSDGMTAGTYIETQLERLATHGWSESHEFDTVRYISNQDTESVATFEALSEPGNLAVADGLSPELVDEITDLQNDCGQCVFVTVEPMMK